MSYPSMPPVPVAKTASLFSKAGVKVRAAGLVALLGKAWPALLLVAVFMIVAVVFSLALGERALVLTLEGGPIELATVIIYGAVVLAGLVMMQRGFRAAGFVSLVSLLMGLRELDAHKAFTTYGVFKIRLYVSPDVPVAEKLIAAVVVIAILVLLVMTVRSAWAELSGRFSASGISLLVLGGFGVFLKNVDGLPRMLEDAGMALDPAMLSLSKAVEEVGEVGLPALLALVLTQMLISEKTDV